MIAGDENPLQNEAAFQINFHLHERGTDHPVFPEVLFDWLFKGFRERI